jgi:hypothetical protein
MGKYCLNAGPVFLRRGRKIVPAVLALDCDDAVEVDGAEGIAGFRLQHADVQPDGVADEREQDQHYGEDKQSSNPSSQLSGGKQSFSRRKTGVGDGI